MPWLKSREIIPPVGKKVVVFENGAKVIKELKGTDVYDGAGSLSPNVPDVWAPESSFDFLGDPKDQDDGWGKKYVPVQNEGIKPKLVNGKAPPSKQSFGPDGFASL